MKTSGIENRRYPRVDAIVCVRTTNPTTPAEQQKTNLSEGGMFIRTSCPFDVGSIIGIEVNLRDEETPLFVKARVVRNVQPGEGREGGMGVEFLSVPPRELSRLRRIVWGALGGKATILVMTKDKDLGDMVWEMLSQRGHTLIRAVQHADLAAAASEQKANLTIVDIDDREKEIQIVKEMASDIPMIVISRKISHALRSRAATLGIFELIEKPVCGDRLLAAISREIQSSKLQDVFGQNLLAASTNRVQLVARSSSMQEVVRQLLALSQLPHSVLITGETGVGKEVVARALHEASPRRTLGLVVADCTMMDKNLMVSMLFGHERGAFTGAQAQHRGLVEQAGGGTLLLDEIGELSTESQAKLLRLLESGTYRRIGGDRDMVCKARIIAATNRDLRSMVRDGAFRQDLLYRLQVHTLVVPPLSERIEDLLPLAHALLQELNEQCKTNVTVLSAKAISQLTSHSWSGNVRELRNVLAASLVGIDGDSLPSLKLTLDPGSTDSGFHEWSGESLADLTWDEFTKASEQQITKYLTELMKRFHGNVTAAAAQAEMTRQNLSKKLREHALKPSDFK